MSNTLPAGKYFVGDPCYVFGPGVDENARWGALLDAANYFDDEVVVSFNGSKLFAAHTRYGDGEYLDQDGSKYPVDSGLIGAVPRKLWQRKESDILRCGRVVVFDAKFEVAGQMRGIIRIGHLLIDTEQAGEEYE